MSVSINSRVEDYLLPPITFISIKKGEQQCLLKIIKIET